jgi:hypothetical protein
VKNFLFIVLFILLPLQSVVGATQKVSHHNVLTATVAHEHSHDAHEHSDHDPSNSHCSVEDLCHSHGASVVSHVSVATLNAGDAVLISTIIKRFPSSLPERIDRPQWSPAV